MNFEPPKLDYQTPRPRTRRGVPTFLAYAFGTFVMTQLVYLCLMQATVLRISAFPLVSGDLAMCLAIGWFVIISGLGLWLYLCTNSESRSYGIWFGLVASIATVLGLAFFYADASATAGSKIVHVI